MDAVNVKLRIDSVLVTLNSLWMKVELGESDDIFVGEVGKIKEVTMVLMGLGLTENFHLEEDIDGVNNIVTACEKYANFLDDQM
ncbi:hypothetical protein [Photobacterium damselae]|uniref:hypothetical protein n=1 Tax=Photobacterium damselae TaxID=38293 RepID=UPI001F4278BD|nr:hypothetical protein [Photobacterium damselae]UKA04510.1 hypothetical protein IHC89_23085 [Photobacterium damselae subsp. damselae]